MQRKSSEDVPKLASRDSFIGTQAPKLFKMKKNVFNRFGSAKSYNKTEPSLFENSLYSLPNASLSSHSLANNEPRRDMRQGSKQSFSQGSHTQQGSSSHAFQPTAFLRPVKCGVCMEKMWGLSEYRCQGEFIIGKTLMCDDRD